MPAALAPNDSIYRDKAVGQDGQAPVRFESRLDRSRHGPRRGGRRRRCYKTPRAQAVMAHPSSCRQWSARVAVAVAAIVVATDCAGRNAGGAALPDDGAYLVFRNDTEDEVRVFVYAGDRRWLVGHVQAFRQARFHVPTDLAKNSGQVVAVAAVPIGGRGPNGGPTSASVVVSDSEVADGITRFDWTLSGHTLSAAPKGRPRR